MKIQPAVREQTRAVGVGVCVLTALMVGVFLAVGKFDWTVLTGAVLGAATGIANFFLMALTVQKVTDGMPALPKRDEEETEDEEKKEQPISEEAARAGKKMQLSFLLRMLMLGGVAALAVTSPVFHPWAALLPMLFPRIVIALRGLFENKQKEA